MDIGRIGENAGKIWQALSNNGAMSMSQVKKKTTLSDSETNMALGWLAKEEKIAVNKKGKSLNISLI
jgi:hypothetical protein